MAAGSGKGPKFLAGCSCLSMVFFLGLIVAIKFLLPFLSDALPDLAVVWGIVGGIGGYVADGCCCLSGVGLVIGIVLLLLRSRGGDEVA